MIERSHRINFEIKSPTVHLIDNQGQSLGVIPTQQALQKAQESQLDLVEISPKANPPVARLLDYNKFRYELEKKARQSARNVKNTGLKEIQLGYGISPHDRSIKLRQTQEFLSQGYFVRVQVLLKGRQNLFVDKAKQMLMEFLHESTGELEQDINQVSNKVSLTIKPKKYAKSKNT